MFLRLAQGVALRVPLRVVSARETPADELGATLTVTISKNGAVFDTTHGGGTAVEIAHSWYYVDLDATDTNSLGPLLIRATGANLQVCEPSPLLIVPGGGGGGGGATPDEVKAKVVEALSNDTYGETPQEAPAATASLVYKLSWLYKLASNRLTQTPSTTQVYNAAATTVDQKASVSYDGTTFQRDTFQAGP